MRLLLALLFALVALPATAQRAPDSFPGCVYNATPPTLADRQVVPWQCDINGNLLISGGGGGAGTVTDVSVVTANGFAGSVATSTTTPAITLSTTITGILSGNGTAISAASTTGSGAVVLANTPTLVTPVLGAATATSINGLGITSSTGTLTIADGKTLTVSNSLTLAGTDATTMTFPTTSQTIAGLGVAQTFTTTQTIAPATQVSPLVLTGGTLAGTTSRPLIDATQTWNNSGLTATALKVNITNTSSNASSLLADFQVGGTSRLNINSTGGLVLGSTGTIISGSTGNITVRSTAASLTDTGINVASANFFSWNADTFIYRDGAANTVAQRNSTNAQTYRLYGSFTNSSNGDWLESNKTAGGAAYIRTVANGTGTASTLALGVAATNYMMITTAGLTVFGSSAAATSSFPAIKRSSAILVARLGDDSANAAFEAATVDTDGFTVAGLPTAGTAGRRAYVTDQLTACPAIGTVLTGGGAVVCPVFDNGAAWVSG